MAPEERLAELGILLPAPAAPMGSYVPVAIGGGFAFVSGQPPARDGDIVYSGRVGEDISVEDGYEAARLCAINGLAVLKAAVDDLARVGQVVQVLGYVNCSPEFESHPKVVNGASDLLADVFGESGLHSRAAVGAPSLPANMAVEVLMTISLRS